MFQQILSNVVKAAATKRGLGGESGINPIEIAQQRANDAMGAVSSLGNVTPSNIGQSVLNQAQSKLSQIQNPMQTINDRFVAAVNDNSRGKLSTIRDIKSGMPTPGSNNSLRSGGSNILNGLGQNTINTPPPKPMNQGSSDTEILDFLKELSAKRTGFPLEQRMMGGPTDEGQAYLVGEDGPEVFVSPQDGQIIPNPNTVMRESEMQGMGEVVRESELAFSPKQLELMNYMRSLPPGGLNDILGDRNAAVRESELDIIGSNLSDPNSAKFRVGTQPDPRSVLRESELDIIGSNLSDPNSAKFRVGKKSISDEYLESIRQDPDF